MRRRKSNRYLLLAMASSLLGCSAIAFSQGAVAPSASEASSDAMLKSFEPAAGQEYELGSGDELTLEVNGRPELSGKHIIGPDGRITLPVAGDIEIANKTRGDALKAIQAKLGAFYENITVSLRVDHYTSNHVLVLGAVEHPGLMSFDNTPTLLEVISRSSLVQNTSGGSANSTNGMANSFAPVTVPEQCILYRSGEAVLTVQLRKLLKDGDPRANLRLKRDDIVFIPGTSPYVSVLGSVSHPGLVRLDSASTLPEILAESGGLTDKSGRYPKILVVHGAGGDRAGSIETVSFKPLLEASPVHLTLHSGDVIYVPESGYNRAADSLQKISPLLTLITLGALLN